MAKATLVRGMRDFSAQDIYAREYIFDTIRSVYRKYGFQPLETPVMENLEVLTDKYGEEGDKLLFKVLDSGDFMASAREEELKKLKSFEKAGMKNIGENLGEAFEKFLNGILSPERIVKGITSKGLRYDLTVPLARYVAMYRNDLIFPFKRYQIDKVWRADRPQKGRYREFYQCDADVIGSPSLIYDAECILIFDEVLSKLKMPAFTIKINNRKVLAGIAEAGSFSDKFNSFAIAIDKMDKIGEEGVVRELGGRGFNETQIHRIQQMFRLSGSFEEKLSQLVILIGNSQTGQKGISELRILNEYLENASLQQAQIELDLKLARGLDYYTSTIFEVVLNDVQIGSIASGGRYDELTASFGFPDMPGVGISFGAERIYDVMEELDLLPEIRRTDVKVLVINFGGDEEKFAFGVAGKLRKVNISTEMYPAAVKLGKQFQYADKKGIPYVLIVGSEEIKNKVYQLKNIITGEQESLTFEQLISKLS